jgi:hypothetical protein
MKTKLLLCLTLVLSSISFGQPIPIPPPLPDPPPPPGPNLPGENAGKIRTYWLAPYVRVSEGFGGSKVTWFDTNGRIKRQVNVSNIEPGFVITTPGETILGVNENWKITLPPEPTTTDTRHSLSGYITSTPDSRVFVHEYHPKGGMIAEDIYIHGKLVNTVGPFFQHGGNEIALNDDGSASLLIWGNEFKTNVRTVTLDTDGHIVKPKTAQSHPTPDLGPNPVCVGRVPGTDDALFWTSIGFETNSYHLFDEDTGKQLWDIPCPGGGQRLAEGLTPKFIIFAVAELYGGGLWRGSEWVFLNNKKGWIRTFYAVNVQNGRIEAHWRAFYSHRYCDSDYGHFLWLKNQLFYITPGEFTKINFEDILAKRNGWQ